MQSLSQQRYTELNGPTYLRQQLLSLEARGELSPRELPEQVGGGLVRAVHLGNGEEGMEGGR